MLKQKMIFAGTLVALTAFWGCGKSNDSSTTEDTSASGSIAAVVGGTYNGSSSGGTQAMIQKGRLETLLASLDPIHPANASSACPTFSSTTLLACLSSTQSLTYSDCSFGNSSATWNGGVSLTCSGTLSSPTVTRAFSTPTTRANSFGTVITIKDSGTLSTFNTTVAGGGTTLTPTSLNIGGTQFTGAGSAGSALFDFVVTTSSPLTISGGLVNGTVTIYHNYAKVIGTAHISNVGFSVGCCTPTSGSITTTFQAYGIFAAKSGFAGASETLSFTGCGTATYTGPEGYSGNVTVSNCI